MKTYIIYEISCFDTNITDIYIGSTTNFRVRKNKHKTDCNNINSKSYNLYIYNIIRANGGFNNWDMHPIEQIECKTKIESRIREQYWIEKNQSKLNMVKAYISEENSKVIHRQKYKEYSMKNVDKIKDRKAEYYNANKDKINQKHKEFYDDNKDKINQKHLEYYYANKDIISQQRREKYAKKKAELLIVN